MAANKIAFIASAKNSGISEKTIYEFIDACEMQLGDNFWHDYSMEDAMADLKAHINAAA